MHNAQLLFFFANIIDKMTGHSYNENRNEGRRHSKKEESTASFIIFTRARKRLRKRFLFRKKDRANCKINRSAQRRADADGAVETSRHEKHGQNGFHTWKEGCAVNQVILRMEHITKRFPGVLALDDCRLTLAQGEVHGLIGENGAGKSTLMKVLCGIYRKDEGQILFEDREVDFANTRESLQSGICMIHQELNLMPHLTVAQNMYINRENEGRRSFFVHDRVLNEKAAHYLEELHVKIPPTTRVRELSVAKQQMVEIAKAISYNSKILIMDEPTAALTDEETEDLFRVVEKLKASGMAIVYISHRMDELKRICDKITIMRDGRYIQTSPMQEITVNEIIAKMVGREVEVDVTKTERALGEDYILEVEHLTRRGKFEDVSFKLRRGEILGFSGLMGAGRTEVARALFGADLPDSGTVRINGKPVRIRNTTAAVRHGIGYLSEDRKALGILGALPVTDNIVVSSYNRFCYGQSGVVRRAACTSAAEDYIGRLRIKTPSAAQKIKFLSGGNQQKVIIAKWLLRACDILIFDEPTRGIDIGAKNEIYELLRQLADAGKSIIMISSEMAEILKLSDRIAVMSEGRLTGVIDGRDATQESVMKLATLRQS